MRRVAVVLMLLAGSARAASVEDLVRAYPAFLSGFDGTDLIWRDGTRMSVTAGSPESILDQLAVPYPHGEPGLPPLDDPGRVRNKAFFDKMYGDCRQGGVASRLVRVMWLPRSWGHTVSISSVNGVDRALAAVSAELDTLPDEEKVYLHPLGGTYNCRDVAGSHDTSMHSWGVAIDLNTAFADYWRWRSTYRDRYPVDIVGIFERHGFIWGGRWSHFDTMHFEYRPELLDAP